MFQTTLNKSRCCTAKTLLTHIHLHARIPTYHNSIIYIVRSQWLATQQITDRTRREQNASKHTQFICESCCGDIERKKNILNRAYELIEINFAVWWLICMICFAFDSWFACCSYLCLHNNTITASHARSLAHKHTHTITRSPIIASTFLFLPNNFFFSYLELECILVNRVDCRLR